MYTIVLIAALFGSPNSAAIPTTSQFITREACQLVADKLTAASHIQHQCVSVKQ